VFKKLKYEIFRYNNQTVERRIAIGTGIDIPELTSGLYILNVLQPKAQVSFLVIKIDPSYKFKKP
jgi:hypothetical protein